MRLIENSGDLDRSILCFQKATLSVTGIPSSRFKAALYWASICDIHLAGSSFDAYRQAMAILPQLVWVGHSVESRYADITGVGDICTKAVVAAIAKQDYSSALEWFEEGRSIVWRQMMQLRAPFDDLSAVNHKLAAELKQTAEDLDRASSRKPMRAANELSDEHSLENAARRHRRLAERWEKLITQARCVPGFQDFLRPRKASELIRSAHSGAVVVLNLHNDRSDALVIRRHNFEVTHLPLDRFSLTKAAIMNSQMSHLLLSLRLINRGFKPKTHMAKANLEPMLLILWEDVVQPILNFLGYTVRAIFTFSSWHITHNLRISA